MFGLKTHLRGRKTLFQLNNIFLKGKPHFFVRKTHSHYNYRTVYFLDSKSFWGPKNLFGTKFGAQKFYFFLQRQAGRQAGRLNPPDTRRVVICPKKTAQAPRALRIFHPSLVGIAEDRRPSPAILGSTPSQGRRCASLALRAITAKVPH